MENPGGDDDGDGDGDGDECPIGAEGCACTNGGSCDAGLDCLSDLCVDPSSGNGSGGEDSGAGGSGGNESGGDGGDASGGMGGLSGEPAGGSGGDVLGPPPPHCGDGTLDADEVCDDGNLDDGDGCSRCLAIDSGSVCPQPGELCFPIHVCGDGVVQDGEECDDGNLMDADGCGASCTIEPSWECSGGPSRCAVTKCGDSMVEGVEACDDGNDLPGDGCSATCQLEPDCSSEDSCSTRCGDGIRAESEECDDGNRRAYDGCAADCTLEEGHVCQQARVCESAGSDCKWELPVIYRDFTQSHSDFHEPYPTGTDDRECDGYAAGMVATLLDSERKPSFEGAPAHACVSNFSDWYVDSDSSTTIAGSIKLWDTGSGFANRSGENGEPYVRAVTTETETPGGISLEACENACVEMARNGQGLFDGESALICDNTCNPATQAVANQQYILEQLEAQLETAKDEGDDAELIASLEADIEQAESDLADAEAAVSECFSDCNAELQSRIDECTPQCGPCSFDPDQYCVGTEYRELDGDPLFFPIDGLSDESAGTLYAARIPAQYYGGAGWPWEDPACSLDATCSTDMVHNFHFTTETAYHFAYTEGMTASLTVLGDDDMWVYLNGRLLLDMGGIHVPLGGELTISADGAIDTTVWRPEDPWDDTDDGELLSEQSTTAATLGMMDGGIYELKFFHAERLPEGSSLMIRADGLDPVVTTCMGSCGDGVLASGEECDRGTAQNTGGYNGCQADCQLGEYCGDGVLQSDHGEECDPGISDAPSGCIACKLP